MAQRWQCMVCGYIHEGDRPPEECPVCAAPWAAFDQQPAEQPPPEVVAPRPAGHRFVVIGNSSAGRSAAQAIRKLNPNARITVLSEETEPFHYRPILPDFIGGMPEARVFRAARGVYSDEGLDLVPGECVERIDTAARALQCRSGRTVPFDSLLIASGSTPIRVPWPGSEAEGIAYFRTFADARAIARLAEGASRAVVVGGGLLALEFVRAFLAKGLRVTMLVRDDRVGSPALDPDAGSILERRLAELGVDVALQEEVAAFEAEAGRVRGVRTSRGRDLPCEVVGVAVGVRPRTDFLQGSGIACDRGILVDERYATNVPGIYAAGDVAQAYDLAYGAARVGTSWRLAREQGEIAGFNMAGAHVRSPGVVGSNVQIFGGIVFTAIGAVALQDESARVEKEFDASAARYAKLIYRGGRLVGAALVGDTSRARELEQEIRGDARRAAAASAAGIAGGIPDGDRQTAGLGRTAGADAPARRRGPTDMRKMTEENLKAALAGESQAHIKYLNFSEKAKREGKENVARLFAAASYAEQVHASAHLRALKGIGSTADNLDAAVGGEGFEVDEMYPAYIAVAEAQGETAAKNSFYRALDAEKVHRQLYSQALEMVKAGKDAEVGALHVCSVCGWTGAGEQPDECPLCGAPADKLVQF